jgi:hypothetical protein
VDSPGDNHYLALWGLILDNKRKVKIGTAKIEIYPLIERIYSPERVYPRLAETTKMVRKILEKNAIEEKK